MNEIQSIGIVGTGNFAQVLRSLFLHSEWRLKQSSRTKAVDHANIFPLAEVLNCDVIFLAIPISVLESFLKENAHLIRSATQPLLCDVCSVKVRPAQWMESLLPQSIDILATHPIFGPQSSMGGTHFTNLPFVVSPIRIQNQMRLTELLAFLTKQGIVLHSMSPGEHDSRMANSQAVAFLIGTLGIRMNLQCGPLDTHGFNLLLENQRIVESDTKQLFHDLFTYNPFATQMLAQMKIALETIQIELSI